MGNSNQLKISSHTIHKLNTAHSTNHMQAHLIRAKWNKTLCHIFHCHCVVCVASVNYYLCGHCHHHHQHKNHNCTVAPSHSQNRITTFLFAFFLSLIRCIRCSSFKLRIFTMYLWLVQKWSVFPPNFPPNFPPDFPPSHCIHI